MKKFVATFLTTVTGICLITCSFFKSNNSFTCNYNNDIERRQIITPSITREENLFFKNSHILNDDNFSELQWDASTSTSGNNISNSYYSDYYSFSLLYKSHVEINITDKYTMMTNYAFYFF